MYIMYFIYGAVDFKIVLYRKGSMDGGGGGWGEFLYVPLGAGWERGRGERVREITLRTYVPVHI
jgi:hypothetical protein